MLLDVSMVPRHAVDDNGYGRVRYGRRVYNILSVLCCLSSLILPMSVSYLRSLPAVRERSQQVFDLIVQGHSDHWDYHPEHLPAVVDFCAALIKVSALTCS